VKATPKGTGGKEERADPGSLLVWNGRVTRVEPVSVTRRGRRARRVRSPPRDAERGVRVP